MNRIVTLANWKARRQRKREERAQQKKYNKYIKNTILDYARQGETSATFQISSTHDVMFDVMNNWVNNHKDFAVTITQVGGDEEGYFVTDKKIIYTVSW